MNSSRVIGIDESGKGDFFGPLVVAGLLAGNDEKDRLRDIGVRDSKKLSDKVVVSLASILRQEFEHHLLILSPSEYNRRYDRIRNLNILLAECHASVISHMSGRYETDMAVSDKFGKTERLESAMKSKSCRLPLRQIVRGESIPQVAAASILARAAFIGEIGRLESRFDIHLPKGAASQVDEAGRLIAANHGVDILSELSKLHFKNYIRITASL